MAVTASKLRANIYRILDQVLETGLPVEIERRGKRLKIVLAQPRSKLDNLVSHHCRFSGFRTLVATTSMFSGGVLEPHPGYITGDPEDLVHIDWSEYRSGEDQLDRP